MSAEPHWSMMISALALPAVAIFGAFIAWNLWKTNRDILRERLFDRRFAIFQATQSVLSNVAAEGRLSWDAANLLSDLAQRARFMFSSEDAQYYDLIRQKAVELAELTSVTDKKLPSQGRDERERQRALCSWFNEQIDEVFSRMNKYLLFDR